MLILVDFDVNGLTLFWTGENIPDSGESNALDASSCPNYVLSDFLNPMETLAQAGVSHRYLLSLSKLNSNMVDGLLSKRFLGSFSIFIETAVFWFLE